MRLPQGGPVGAKAAACRADSGIRVARHSPHAMTINPASDAQWTSMRTMPRRAKTRLICRAESAAEAWIIQFW